MISRRNILCLPFLNLLPWKQDSIESLIKQINNLGYDVGIEERIEIDRDWKKGCHKTVITATLDSHIVAPRVCGVSILGNCPQNKEKALLVLLRHVQNRA